MKGIDGVIHAYCDDRHARDRLAARNCYEEMASYISKYADDILDVVDIAKTSADYCIGNVCFHTISRKRLFDSVYPDFIDYLGELEVLTRTYTTLIEIICCLDGDVRYHTIPKRFTYKEEFTNAPGESLGAWITDYAIPGVRGWVEETGDDKCKALSPSLYLCDWVITHSDAWEDRR